MAKEIYKMSDLEEVAASLEPGDLAFDTETIGKYGKIRLAQFYQRHWEQAIVVEYPDPMELMLLFIKHGDSLNIIMQYAIYDVSTIQRQTGSRFIPPKFDDTFLLARLAFPHLDTYTLDALIEYALDGKDPYREANIDKKAMHKANWKALVLDEKQVMYAAIDVYYLFYLYDKIKEQADSLNYKLDMHSLRSAMDWQNNGLPVDYERVEERYRQNMAAIKELDMPINVNSYKQVRPYIGSDMSDDLGLAKLSMDGNERAADVRKCRKLIKENSFLNKYESDDGRIYGIFAPTARSGRYTCSDQNLQQLPRKHKSMFGVQPGSGRVLLYSDYSQLELRCIAAITNEKKIIELYQAGEDLHDYVATMLFGKDFTPKHRQIAKTCNFNLLYGGGAGMFQSILIKDAEIFMELEDCQKISRKWKRLFPAIAAWQEKGVSNFHRGVLGKTPFGRRYAAKMMTDQLNIQNQGFGSEVAKLAMHYMYPKLKELGVDLCNFVHDSFICEMDDNEELYIKAAKIVGDAMHDAWVEASKMVEVRDLPMPVKVHIGYNWGDIEEGDFIHEYKLVA